MIIVSVLYPAHMYARFDLVYYREEHLPLVRRLLETCGLLELTWFVPIGPDASFRLIAELRFATMTHAEQALRAHGPQTQADIVNFTDILPIVVMGEAIAA